MSLTIINPIVFTNLPGANELINRNIVWKVKDSVSSADIVMTTMYLISQNICVN